MDKAEDQVILDAAKEFIRDGAILREIYTTIERFIHRWGIAIVHGNDNYYVLDMAMGKPIIAPGFISLSGAVYFALDEAARRLTEDAVKPKTEKAVDNAESL